MFSYSILFGILQVSLQLSACVSAGPTRSPNHSQAAVTVTLKTGTLEGVSDRTYDQDFFLGIPYARPPINDLRFRRPQPLEAWSGTKVAQEYGSWCYGIRLGLQGFSQNITEPMSEDCLTLNIVRPAQSPRHKKLPVAVWIHGGDFLEGSGADQRYNGSFLVQESVAMGTPMIYISLNYRLGIFGLLAGPNLERTGDTNLALHDQRMALAWIQENISRFNGDPTRVTIMGESAGAASVGFHLLADGGKSRKLYQAAIAQSGGPFSYRSFKTAAERSNDYQSAVQRLNCSAALDTLNCLKNVPAATLHTINGFTYGFPMIDGDLIKDYPSTLLANGNFRKVPLLIGSNRNEGTPLLPAMVPMPINNESAFSAMIEANSPGGTLSNATLQRWSDLYQDELENPSTAGLGAVSENPGPIFGALYGKASLWLGDWLFTSGRRYANQVWSKHGVPTFSYFFDTVAGSMDPAIFGAPHFHDVAFTFGNVNGVGWEENPYGTPNPQEMEEVRSLAKTMSRMWISFVVHKTPNMHKMPGVQTWPAYSKATATNMVFSASSGVHTEPDTWRQEALQMFITLASYSRR